MYDGVKDYDGAKDSTGHRTANMSFRTNENDEQTNREKELTVADGELCAKPIQLARQVKVVHSPQFKEYVDNPADEKQLSGHKNKIMSRVLYQKKERFN